MLPPLVFGVLEPPKLGAGGLNGRHKPPQAPPKEGMSAAPEQAFLSPSFVCFAWGCSDRVDRYCCCCSPRSQ